jgi:hypothetical protein
MLLGARGSEPRCHDFNYLSDNGLGHFWSPSKPRARPQSIRQFPPERGVAPIRLADRLDPGPGLRSGIDHDAGLGQPRGVTIGAPPRVLDDAGESLLGRRAHRPEHDTPCLRSHGSRHDAPCLRSHGPRRNAPCPNTRRSGDPSACEDFIERRRVEPRLVGRGQRRIIFVRIAVGCVELAASRR